ncbi:hypothetical protein JTB14_030410 [Gonioctena quinquepunctata]|nr:hypothetical protein JTB14_030410 [Gonioctena quinquepunctata]
MDMTKEYTWLKDVETVVAADELQGDEIITWAAYNGIKQVHKPKECDKIISSLLPLFPVEAHSVAMTRQLRLQLSSLIRDRFLFLHLTSVCKTNSVELANNSW